MNPTNLPIRIVAWIALLGSLVLSLEKVRPQWATRLGVDWWNLSELYQTMRSDEKEAVALQQKFAAITERIEGKRRLVREVGTGRLGLLDAARALQKLYKDHPETALRYLELMPGTSEGERLCLQVIESVRGETEVLSPTAADAVANRLEDELREHREREGTVRLPAE